MSICKFCGEKIEWSSVDGRATPVHPEYVDYDDAEHGEYLVTDGGNLYKVDENKSYPNVRGRISHINTCRKGASSKL